MPIVYDHNTGTYIVVDEHQTSAGTLFTNTTNWASSVYDARATLSYEALRRAAEEIMVRGYYREYYNIMEAIPLQYTTEPNTKKKASRKIKQAYKTKWPLFLA